MQTIVQPKNPTFAAVLSFLINGLGQVYNGEIGKGILIFVIQLINLALMAIFIGFITAPIVFIWSVFDAYQVAQRINAQAMQQNLVDQNHVHNAPSVSCAMPRSVATAVISLWRSQHLNHCQLSAGSPGSEEHGSVSNRCSQCGTENLDQARFCMHCSQPLKKSCARCGANLALTARFCAQCGTLVTPAAATPAALTGRLTASTVVASRYQIVRKLGQGGMGAVYQAEDLRLPGKHWAVKEMSDAAIADPQERQQAVVAFQQEAQLLASLDHVHLPKVTDYFSEGGNQYLVMEFVRGETLEARLARANAPLPEAQVLHYTGQLCDVLDYLHRRQPPIIFRDLKPANIMLQPDDWLKLIDFGIARHFKPGKSKDTQAMGTPGFAAPEQYGHGQSDARSDVYALGATIHQMVTGRDPGGDPFHFEPVQRLNPSASPPLAQVVARAVEMKPEQRWQTVADLRRALTSPLSPPPAVPVTSPTGAGGAQPRSATPPTVAMSAPPKPLPATAPPALPGMVFAAYGKRAGAFLIDMLIYGGLLLVYGLITSSAGSSATPQCMATLLLLASFYFYLIRPTAATGQTFGKRTLGIRVVNRDGDPPGLGRALIRYVLGFGVEVVLAYVLVGFLGLLWPLWDKDKQTWHDKIAGTYVVEV